MEPLHKRNTMIAIFVIFLTGYFFVSFIDYRTKEKISIIRKEAQEKVQIEKQKQFEIIQHLREKQGITRNYI